MEFWIRSATLQIGPNRYSMEDLNFEFEVPFEDSSTLTTAKFTVYNLSERTRSSIKKDQPVILNAGYEGDVGCIFVGRVSACSHQHQDTEWITKLTATAALEEWLAGRINKTYAQRMTAQEMVPDLLNIFGLEVGQLELKQDKTYERGRVCQGKLKDVLQEIVVGECKSRMLIRGGQLLINKPEDGVNKGYCLTPESGLLWNANDVEETVIATALESQQSKTEKDEAGATKTRECLLNYHLGPADQIQIRSRTLNGKFLIVRGKHTGSPTGQWKTTIEVKPV